METHRKNRPSNMNVGSLDAIQKALAKFNASFKRHLAPVMPSKGNTLKYHKLSHVTQSIRRLGHPREYSAQFYEASNKQQKTSYNGTNKKKTKGKFLKDMVTHQSIRLAVSTVSSFNVEAEVKRRSSAYLEASKTGENTMASCVVLSLPLMPDGNVPLDVEDKVKQYIEDMGDYSEVARAVCAKVSPAGADVPIARVRSTAVLSASVPWMDEETELQTVRACPAFHGKPYYDRVVYVPQGTRTRRYGELRLIFKIREHATGGMVDMVCIRSMSETKHVDLLVRNGCTHLQLTSEYEVVPLRDVSNRIYIVPDFDRMESGVPYFHICRWKWNRRPIQDYVAQ